MQPDIDLLLKLVRSPEFAHYCALLRAKREAAIALFPELIATPADQATYNQQRGFMQGLDVALALVPRLTKEPT